MDLSSMSIKETEEFVSNKLNLPDLAVLFADNLDIQQSQLEPNVNEDVHHDHDDHDFIVTVPQPSPAAAPSPNRPVPQEFPIDRVLFTPVGLQMIETGKVSIAGKSAITNAMVAMMQTFSSTTGYASYDLKRMAASALVNKYPKLQMGLGVKTAVDCWHKAFGEKLRNWRKRGKIQDPQMEVMKFKYKKTADMSRQRSTVPAVQASLSRRNSTMNGDLTEEEKSDQEERKQMIIDEFSKPRRNRNQRFLDIETQKTFVLRRKFVLESSPHAQILLKEWPSMKVESILLKELTRIVPDANSFSGFSDRLESLLPKLMDEALDKSHSYPKNHPLPALLRQVPNTGTTELDFDTDQHAIGAVAGLTYILPTTAKKTTPPFRYLIDTCAADATQEDIRDAVQDRRQPYVQIFGTVPLHQKVIVYADKVPVCTCTSVCKALYAVMALYFLLDVEYASPISTTMEFIQTVFLNVHPKRPHVRVRDFMKKIGM